MNEATYIENRIFDPRSWKVSWGAIFAGLSITIVIQFTLSLLGIAIGASTIDPVEGDTPGQGLAIGSAIWILLSGLIALFLGAMVAGRLSGGMRPSDGLWHGIIMWSVATLVTIYLLATTAGALIGGTGRLIGNAMGLGQQVQVGSQQQQEVMDTAREKFSQAFPEAADLLPPTGRESGTASPAGQLTQMAQQDPELASALTKMQAAGGASQAPEARNQAIQILTTKHGMAQPAAESMVAQWNQEFQQAKAEMREEAKEVGQAAAEGVSRGALWAFFALVLGAAAAAFGGNLGARFWLKPAHPRPVT